MTAQSAPTIREIDVPPPGAMYRFSVDQYRAMIQSGVLREGEPTELIHGYLLTKMPKNEPHAFVTGTLEDVIRPQLGEGYIYRSQDPISLADSEPEPDGVIARGTRRDFLQSHPTPERVLLAIEVADATLAFDRTTKRSLYASSAVQRYWVVNLIDRVVEVYTEPTSDGEYLTHHTARPGEQLTLEEAGSVLVTVAVSGLFP